MESPKTQSVESVKALLKWRGRGSDLLPDFVEIGQGEGHVVLVLSNKRDCFYVVTPKACSCPSQTYRGGQCKHMRKYYPQIAKPVIAEEGESIRPVAKWAGGMNGPVDPAELKEVV